MSLEVRMAARWPVRYVLGSMAAWPGISGLEQPGGLDGITGAQRLYYFVRTAVITAAAGPEISDALKTEQRVKTTTNSYELTISSFTSADASHRPAKVVIIKTWFVEK